MFDRYPFVAFAFGLDAVLKFETQGPSSKGWQQRLDHEHLGGFRGGGSGPSEVHALSNREEMAGHYDSGERTERCN
jgi:hypothetical protein